MAMICDSIEQAVEQRRQIKQVFSPQATAVLTNGCFDTFHRGHLETLKFAKRQGWVLFVAVNTDESIRTLKGPHRPIHKLADRLAIVAEIPCVDYVVPFGTAEDPSVESLVKQLEPDILVKGGDYRVSEVVGGAVVEERGGRVVIAPVLPGLSSTRTIEKLATEGTETTERSRVEKSVVTLNGRTAFGIDVRGPSPSVETAPGSPDLRSIADFPESRAMGRDEPRFIATEDLPQDALVELDFARGTACRAPQHEPRATGDGRRVRPAPVALVDLDGVLVDFIGSMARTLNLPWDPGQCRGRYDPAEIFHIPTDLFSLFGPDFWESCDWMPDGRAIWETVLRLFGEDQVYICSSPTHESSSAMGKLRWIERHLPERWMRRYIFTPCKEVMSRPGAILLDDSDANVKAFRAANGRAVLVPRPWNSLWGFHGKVVDDIEVALISERRP